MRTGFLETRTNKYIQQSQRVEDQYAKQSIVFLCTSKEQFKSEIEETFH